jgi:hypothetical protein
MKGCFALAAVNTASAGPWSVEPQVGASAAYSTNPELRAIDPISEHPIAGMFSVPLYYDADALDVTVTPSGRLSDTSGYSSLASNFARLSASGKFSTELDSFAAQAGLSRDSSLYETGQIAYGYGVGVRRDTSSAGGEWTHIVTERTQFELDTSWSRVLYDQPADTTNLVDYHYYSAGPTVSYSLSERDSLKLISGFGHYLSLNGDAKSNSSNLQLGVVRQLSEVWTLSGSFGYSRLRTYEKIFFGPFYLGTFDSEQNGAVYALSLNRTGEQFNFAVNASKALQPFGSYGLSRQESYGVSGSYTLSERLTFSATGGWVQELDPNQTGGEINVHYLDAQFRVDFHATPQWMVSLRATQDSRKFGSDLASVQSTGVVVDVVRQFLRSEL